MTLFNLRKRGSGMALAIALATGTAVVATAVMPAEAHAQRSKKKKEDAPQYSKAWIAAYSPIETGLQAEGADANALRPLLPQAISLAQSGDEKLATGQVVLNTGLKLQDTNLQLQGIELMLESNKLALADLGRFNFNAYVLSNNTKQYGKARNFLSRAISLNYSADGVTQEAMQITLAELFWVEGMTNEGLASIKSAMETRKAAGLTIDPKWYGRAITVAYQQEAFPQLWEMLAMRSADYPTGENWRDWMNRIRNLTDLTTPEVLDLLRFGRTVGALDDKQDYLRYVEVVDARRSPKEAKDVIEESYASGVVSRDDIYVADQLEIANGRIASDRADLPALEADADAAGAQLRTVVAAADAFYSYGEYAKSAKFYEKALAMPGVDTAEATTRLGMAQVGLGEYAAARDTFAKVNQGARVSLAKIWSAYAEQQIAPEESSEPTLSDLLG